MRSGFWIVFAVFSLILLLTDLYAYKAVRMVIKDITGEQAKRIIMILYWSVTVLLISGMLMIGLMGNEGARSNKMMPYFQFFFGVMILFLLPKLVIVIFHGLEDIGYLAFRGFKWIKGGESNQTGEALSRRLFLTQAGLILSAIPFLGVLYGITKGKYNFTVERVGHGFKNLPASFEGLKIAQISDLHLGSFLDNYKSVEKGIDLLNSLKPDVIFFTGDMVNNYAYETDGWKEILSKLEAPMGKYSILGNHDYSDYVPWDSEQEKAQNLARLKAFHKEIDFRLLINESVTLEKGSDKINIIGIENWGKGGFSKYGDLEKASKGYENFAFNILLSHDPSHWEEQVLKKKNIDLTFSGHTHGMQFGVKLGNWRYSPVQHRYKRWAGKYEEKKQVLYINKGFGFIGFPGRVGMPPEITLFELKKNSV